MCVREDHILLSSNSSRFECIVSSKGTGVRWPKPIMPQISKYHKMTVYWYECSQRETERDRERQRETERDRERQRSNC